MITAHNIVKSFGDTAVLQGLNLSIRRGGIYGLAGRSGAGKSTLLRCINGLERYDSGSLIVDGIDVKTLSRKEVMSFRKNIGMIFQHFSLLERLTVYDNIALPLRCWKYKSNVIDKKVRELLEVVGIPEKIRQKPRELSGGQKQRVAIARALTMDPHILLCDEATSALDPKTSQAIISLLREINRQMGITIVFVTHQMPVLRDLCREIAILENGKVAVSGMVEEVFSQHPEALRNLVGDDIPAAVGKSEKTATLLLPDTVTGSFISRMARLLGIDITIQGRDSGSSSETAPGFAITFAEKSRHDVEDHLLGNEIVWDVIIKHENGPGQTKAYGNRQEAKAATIRPEMAV